jgi:beta-galactosidase/beta-glucuronidase
LPTAFACSAVTVGIWLGHERHGFDYGNPQQLQQQREAVKRAVEALRDHPAVLTWGLGNEMEGPTGSGDSPEIWQEVDRLAGLIKSLDDAHPVMTVVANVNPAEVAAI